MTGARAREKAREIRGKAEDRIANFLAGYGPCKHCFRSMFSCADERTSTCCSLCEHPGAKR